jgi:GH15 family glucan-1,4-alpha-glucosidase
MGASCWGSRPQDPRVQSTDDAIERELMFDGFVARYLTTRRLAGLPAGEDMFLPCSSWLDDNLASQRRNADGEALFERLLPVRNDVGLLSKEYDPRTRRQLGNFSQALSHVD